MMRITDFDDFLETISQIKSGKYDVKIPTGALAHLLMFGSFDKIIKKKDLSLADRTELIEETKDAANSDASFSNTKQPKLDINNIRTEFHRLLWMKNVCPIYTLKIHEFYNSAILSMQSYKPAPEKVKRHGIVYIKEPMQGHDVWIFKSWTACTKPAILDKIISINNDDYQPKKVAVGFIAIIDKYLIKHFTSKKGDSNEMCDITFDDGQGYFSGIVWSDWKSHKISVEKIVTIKSNLGKPCISIGKITRQGHFISFNVWEIQELLT